MLLLAILGVLVNGFAALRLRKGGSLNERVVSLHLLEDVLGLPYTWFYRTPPQTMSDKPCGLPLMNY